MGLPRMRRRRSVGTAAALCCCLVASARAAGDTDAAGPLAPAEEVGPPLIREESASEDREPRRRELGTEKREGRKHFVEKKMREEADQANGPGDGPHHTMDEVKDYFVQSGLTIDLSELSAAASAAGDAHSDVGGTDVLVQQSSSSWCDCGNGDWSAGVDDFHYFEDDDDDDNWYDLSWFADVAGEQDNDKSNRELKHHKSGSKWKGGGRSKSGRSAGSGSWDDDYDDDDDKWSRRRSKGGKSKGGKTKGVVSSGWKRSKAGKSGSGGKAGKSGAKGGKSAGSGNWDDDYHYDYNLGDSWESAKCKCDYPSPDINNDGSLKNPIEVDKGDSVTVNVLENDVAKGPRPNRLSVERIANQARNGKCAVAFGKRRVVYTPDRGYTGRDRCAYRACDSRDMCGEANVFFDVIADTFVPTLSPTLVPTLSPTFFPTLAPTLAPAGSPDIENVGSLNNPIDVPAGETTTIDALEDDRPARPLPNRLKIEGVTRQARNGRCRVTSNGRELNYTPDDGYDGRDSCQIEVCDSRDVCDKASVFLNVEGEMEPTFSPSLSPTLSPSRFPTELPTFTPSTLMPSSPEGLGKGQRCRSDIQCKSGCCNTNKEGENLVCRMASACRR
mmetsp:Transcript_36444/g.83120  ORF Transcript_36444/g.83120 Transcript_36444/m.83120 type:complete len:614 (-) Transcript_36444:106-1947(-)